MGLVHFILYEPVIQKKLDAIHLAEKLGNVTEAARTSGCSRETIYKNRRLLKEKGPLALKRIFKVDILHKNRIPQDIEKIVIQFSLKNSHLEQAQVCAHLKSIHIIELSPNGVRGVWIREKLNTCAMRTQRSNTFHHVQN
jgi:hypothetical protein